VTLPWRGPAIELESRTKNYYYWKREGKKEDSFKIHWPGVTLGNRAINPDNRRLPTNCTRELDLPSNSWVEKELKKNCSSRQIDPDQVTTSYAGEATGLKGSRIAPQYERNPTQGNGGGKRNRRQDEWTAQTD